MYVAHPCPNPETGLANISIKVTHVIVLQWRHNERDRVSNHRPLEYLLNRLFRRRS